MLRLLFRNWPFGRDRSKRSERQSLTTTVIDDWLRIWCRRRRGTPLKGYLGRHDRWLRHLGCSGLGRLDAKENTTPVVILSCFALNFNRTFHCTKACFGIEWYPTVETT
jgi:hypothetical protein